VLYCKVACAVGGGGGRSFVPEVKKCSVLYMSEKEKLIFIKCFFRIKFDPNVFFAQLSKKVFSSSCMQQASKCVYCVKNVSGIFYIS
jgi:hypothetical protein